MAAPRAVLRLLSLSPRAVTSVCSVCGLVSAAGLGAGACYSAGSGSGPPTSSLYYPVGLAVSTAATAGAHPGDVLYVVNSDFDLQYNGGTLQSYDLNNIRQDTAAL